MQCKQPHKFPPGGSVCRQQPLLCLVCPIAFLTRLVPLPHHSLPHSFLPGLNWWAASGCAKRRRLTAFSRFATYAN